MADSKHRTFTRKKRSSGEDSALTGWETLDIRLEDVTGSSEKFLSARDGLATELLDNEEGQIELSEDEEDDVELLEAPELPDKYDKDSFVILVVDPFKSYCSWEISDKTMEKVTSKPGFQMSLSRLMLRLYRVSDMGMANAVYCFEKDIHEEGASGSIYIDYSASYKLFYGKIGYLENNGNFSELVQSAIPKEPDLPSFDLYEEGIFEMEVTQGEPVIRSISPPPIPPPAISFQELLTEEIRPELIPEQEREPIFQEDREKNIATDRIEKPRLIVRKKQEEGKQMSFPFTAREIPQFADRKEVPFFTREEFAVREKIPFFTREGFPVREELPFFTREECADRKEISFFSRKIPRFIDREEIPFIHRKTIKTKGRKDIPFTATLKKSPVYSRKLYRFERKVLDKTDTWDIVEFPLHITYLLYDRLTEEIPFPFTGKPSS